MERTKKLLSTIEHLISTKRRRHIIAGVLLSAALFAGGLAATVLSVKIDERDEYEQIYEEIDNE
jgi:hypothetical protein